MHTGRGGLQQWLERGAEGPAFVAVLVCMVLRSSSFYSGGALSLPRLLGAAGLAVFNAVTSLGISVGAELLMSIAGRAWQRYEAEIREVLGRRGLSRAERAAMVSHYTFKARWSKFFCGIGLAASVIGAMGFMWSANPAHTLGAFLGELVVACVLISVTFYLGVLKENVNVDPGQLATEQAVSIRFRLTEEAGRRIAAGQGTPQDVGILAESLPRGDRARFRAVMAADTPDDPRWTASQIASWLGEDTPALRRKISRRLREAQEHGANVLRDDRGAYQVPRSLVLRLFAEDFIASRQRPDMSGTRPGQPRPSFAAVAAIRRDMDTTRTPARQAPDTAETAVPA